MDKKEIFEEVKEVIVEQLGVLEDDVTLEATLVDDLSADSLDIVELVMNIEDKFEISIPDTDAGKIVTVGDIVDYIAERKE